MMGFVAQTVFRVILESSFPQDALMHKQPRRAIRVIVDIVYAVQDSSTAPASRKIHVRMGRDGGNSAGFESQIGIIVRRNRGAGNK